jgi:hypothetical protein
MSDVEKALEECRTALKDAILKRKPDASVLDAFRDNFREDFERELAATGKWNKDRERVTTLARAIGSFAEFLVIAEDQWGTTPVGLAHLVSAYRVLKPYCSGEGAGEVVILREYCTAYNP